MRTCPACDEKVADATATNCPGCGDPLVSDKQGTRECSGCGQAIADKEAKVCPDCETELPAEATEGGNQPAKTGPVEKSSPVDKSAPPSDQGSKSE